MRWSAIQNTIPTWPLALQICRLATDKETRRGGHHPGLWVILFCSGTDTANTRHEDFTALVSTAEPEVWIRNVPPTTGGKSERIWYGNSPLGLLETHRMLRALCWTQELQIATPNCSLAMFHSRYQHTQETFLETSQSARQITDIPNTGRFLDYTQRQIIGSYPNPEKFRT